MSMTRAERFGLLQVNNKLQNTKKKPKLMLRNLAASGTLDLFIADMHIRTKTTTDSL
jgi:hypothetical protein